MNRRDFMAIVGGTAATLPLAASAQQASLPVIGFLNSTSAEGYAARIAAFRQGLAEAGFVEGKNVRIEYRHADGQYDQLPALAVDLVRARVAVIVTTGLTAAFAAKAATATIPIVFSGSGDPVALGLVSSLARPGGNVTGTTRLNVEVTGKRLQLLREMLPAATTFALLFNPTNSALAEPVSRAAQVAAHALGLTLQVLRARSDREIDEAFATLVQSGVGGLMIGPDAIFNARIPQIAALAVRHRMPTIYQDRAFIAAGGLMSYGGSLDDGYRIAGGMTGRILMGAKPADLAVQQSTKLELLINLKTAKVLGITVPPILLALADEVIE
jgi:putative tryptophan/tyrosine transport system substrate-binding protein